jgi:hypothetical protein
MNLLLFVLGAVAGGLIEMVIQHPWEELVEKRFQQILNMGVYRKYYFMTIDYNVLKERLKTAIEEYNFDYAKMLIKQMEWFIEEKAGEEKKKAQDEARLDFHKDIKNIETYKGSAEEEKYNEKENKWEKQ